MARQHIHVSMQKRILFVIYNYPMTMPDKNPNTKHYKISRKTPATIDCTGSRTAQKKKKKAAEEGQPSLCQTEEPARLQHDGTHKPQPICGPSGQ